MSRDVYDRCPGRNPTTNRRCRLSIHAPDSPHRWWWGSAFWHRGRRREEWW